jgi:hypothetical protein
VVAFAPVGCQPLTHLESFTSYSREPQTVSIRFDYFFDNSSLYSRVLHFISVWNETSKPHCWDCCSLHTDLARRCAQPRHLSLRSYGACSSAHMGRAVAPLVEWVACAFWSMTQNQLVSSFPPRVSLSVAGERRRAAFSVSRKSPRPDCKASQVTQCCERRGAGPSRREELLNRFPILIAMA